MLFRSDKQGMVRIHGEIWQVVANTPLKRGDRVKVTQLDGLILKVEPAEEVEK